MVKPQSLGAAMLSRRTFQALGTTDVTASLYAARPLGRCTDTLAPKFDPSRSNILNGLGRRSAPHLQHPSTDLNLLLLALVPACFALNPVIGRALADQFGPATLSVVRWALSALLVALLVGLRGGAERWRATAGLITRLGVLGILGMGFCAFAAYGAARTTEATNIGLIYGCTSAFVAAWRSPPAASAPRRCWASGLQPACSAWC
jgi:hypothetical protein